MLIFYFFMFLFQNLSFFYWFLWTYVLLFHYREINGYQYLIYEWIYSLYIVKWTIFCDLSRFFNMLMACWYANVEVEVLIWGCWILIFVFFCLEVFAVELSLGIGCDWIMVRLLARYGEYRATKWNRNYIEIRKIKKQKIK